MPGTPSTERSSSWRTVSSISFPAERRASTTRLLSRFIPQAVACQRARRSMPDIDIIYLNGYGFPAYRGGPMWHADTVGLQKVYQRVCEFHKQQGELWTPAPLLQRLAEEGKTFAGFDKEQVAAA